MTSPKTSHQTYTSIGLMTGTSMDGIDGALLRTDGVNEIQEVAVASLRYDKNLHHALKRAEQCTRAAAGDLERAALAYEQEACDDFPTFEGLIDHLTDLHIQVVKDILEKEGLPAAQVDVIGFHGQNLFHDPANKRTCQVGNAQRLADATGIDVVHRFRHNDVANGGQGAPFAPVYHQALVNRDGFGVTAIVNCGGISNITVVDGDDVIGFDTGPGNALVDTYVKQITGGIETYDQDGRYGLHGQVNAPLLKDLMNTFAPYIERKPPKSLDIGDLPQLPDVTGISDVDVICTLEHFTAQCIIEGLRWCKTPKRWILAGGGWKNPVIVKALRDRLLRVSSHVTLHHAEDVGWSNDGLEAQIFAYLAVRSLKRLPLSYPATTGVETPMLGGVYVPCGAERSHFALA